MTDAPDPAATTRPEAASPRTTMPIVTAMIGSTTVSPAITRSGEPDE